MANAPNIYSAMSGSSGCRRLAEAFYARVARDPILRPLFPSTFRCATEAFSAFLVQFLGGEAEATQHRWFLSLRESHQRFSIGAREQAAWLRAMAATLSDATAIPDPTVRRALLDFFTHSSAYLVNQGTVSPVASITGELALLWQEQVFLDDAIHFLNKDAGRCLSLLQTNELQLRFARSPSVHANFLAVAAAATAPPIREYVTSQLRLYPALIHAHYRRGRTLLHDAAALGNVELVELLLALGAAKTAQDPAAPSPLYCLANECNALGAAPIIRLLLQQSPAQLNATYGVKQCTPLHMAARRGNVDVITALLEAGAAIESRDSLGETPLRRAVNCNKIAAAKALLARGADPHSIGRKTLTPALAARTPQMKAIFAQNPQA